MDTENSLELNELMIQRREKLNDFKKMNIKPYSGKFPVSHYASDIEEQFEEIEGNEVSLAGRIMAVRTHGKASFADLMDMSGKIQLYVRIDDVGEDKYGFFSELDIGDIIGVNGEVFKTRRGQISIKVISFEFLSKSLRPLPEKWHGLRDKELRYRQRYIDLIVNPEVRKTFIVRSKIIRNIRRFLEEKGFLEVETPMMHPVPGGASARPFITHHNALDIDLYLRIAPELYLKRLIVGGFEKVFELNRNFRNEGMSYKHNPEFTMLELYQAQSDYYDMMELTEELISGIAKDVLGTMKITYQDKEIDLSPPWKRYSMLEAVREFTGLDFDNIKNAEEARDAARELGMEIDDNSSQGEVLNEVFEEKVEEKLVQPIFILDYPIEVSPLAKKKEDNPEFTYRFEAFICSREMANAFT